jgi:hypothetical protein
MSMNISRLFEFAPAQIGLAQVTHKAGNQPADIDGSGIELFKFGRRDI